MIPFIRYPMTDGPTATSFLDSISPAKGQQGKQMMEIARRGLPGASLVILAAARAAGAKSCSSKWTQWKAPIYAAGVIFLAVFSR
jgi:hypothetical protein